MSDTKDTRTTARAEERATLAPAVAAAVANHLPEMLGGIYGDRCRTPAAISVGALHSIADDVLAIMTSADNGIDIAKMLYSLWRRVSATADVCAALDLVGAARPDTDDVLVDALDVLTKRCVMVAKRPLPVGGEDWSSELHPEPAIIALAALLTDTLGAMRDFYDLPIGPPIHSTPESVTEHILRDVHARLGKHIERQVRERPPARDARPRAGKHLRRARKAAKRAEARS